MTTPNPSAASGTSDASAQQIQALNAQVNAARADFQTSIQAKIAAVKDRYRELSDERDSLIVQRKSLSQEIETKGVMLAQKEKEFRERTEEYIKHLETLKKQWPALAQEIEGKMDGITSDP